ncbi:glycosyltransferase [Belliella sp. DSM 111904]|uniref:Glycosyltransferase n=1 Tax=Belliella filtrata TaxID=2923435 RepID=A0ABS9V0Z5_9BACT|nr:glycosyltransferase [Belliella filtrata]MCH7409690.1 glycosyltransferase [Belliella filtrata]
MIFKKKILVISSRPLFPLIGGDRVRTFNTLKILSEKYNIDLIFLKEKDGEILELDELKKYTKTIKCFEFSKFKYFLNTAIGLISNTLPLQVNYYYFKKVADYIDKLVGENEYEFLFSFHIRMTNYLERFNLVKVVDLVDSIGLNYSKAKESSSGIWKLIYNIESTRVCKYEIDISNRFDKVIVISQVDKEFIGNDKIKVIGNFVKTKNVEDDVDVKMFSLSFLGKMNYEPNISAIKYFMYKVYPKLKSKLNDLEFNIIGAYPTKEIRNFERVPGVKVTGFVDDPYEILVKSQIVIAPMVSGAGIQNKILEAMSLGKCVVTTRIGADGLNFLTGNELIVCDDTQSLLLRLEELLNDNNLCVQIGLNAISYINNYHSYEKVKSNYLSYL